MYVILDNVCDKMPLLTMVVNNKINSELDFSSIFQVWPWS